MQSSCIGSLMELAEKDKNVLYLTADSGEGGLDLMFRRNFPERSFDFGIAEENMVAAAAGLASAGKIPFVYTAAPFLAYRAFEFIRNDVCLQNLPVKLIGTGSGMTVSSLGPTHHTTEDVAVLNCLPNLKILSPATPKQAYECVKLAYEYAGPVYIRLGMNKEKEFFTDSYQISNAGYDTLNSGSEVAIFTTGSILENVMESVEICKEKGISVSVINIPVIKPINAHAICEIALAHDILCVVEEHNIKGGLGSIIADILVERGISKKMIKIGLDECFSKGYGNLKQVRIENGLGPANIAERIIKHYE